MLIAMATKNSHKLSENGHEPLKKVSKVTNVTMESQGGPQTQFDSSGETKKNTDAFIMGSLLQEGKTKMIFEAKSDCGERCLVVSKDIITAGDGAKRNEMEGKSILSTTTTTAIMQILNDVGIKTSFIKWVNNKSFLAWNCDMIPIEWVTRRVATGSFLRRFKGVQEGYKFYPPKLETFYKDDENHDPQWSREVLEEAKLKCGDTIITPSMIDIMERQTVAIFEILEQVWQTKGVSLIDMKIEFGIRKDTKEIVLSDVIDNDSWRIWPEGDKRLMKDKQVYRNLTHKATDSDMKNLKENYQWVADQSEAMQKSVKNNDCNPNVARVAVVMGSPSDMAHCKTIQSACNKLGVACTLHISSAHKSTSDTLKLLGQLEGEAVNVPTVIIAVAGRSNGLGPVLSGNSTLPVINSPPVSDKWGGCDIWSSLRLPSGLGCATVLNPEAAAISAAQILAHNNVGIWGRLKAKQLNTLVGLLSANGQVNDL